MTAAKWSIAWRLAIPIYLVLCFIMALQNPGLQYDEALLVHGAQHLVNGTGEPRYAHEPGSWFVFHGHYLPLTVLPYLGSAKDYLLIIPFAVFGANQITARAVAVLLGAIGIWGISVLVRHAAGEAAAAAVALMLAIHPVYIGYTLFDNTGFSTWMGCVGLACIFLVRQIRKPSPWNMFWLGAAIGAGIWERLNFIWFAGSALVAAILWFRGRIIPSIREFRAFALGGLLAVSPFLLYERLSHWGTFRFSAGYLAEGDFVARFWSRCRMLGNALMADSETRAIWGIPPPPDRFALTLLVVPMVGVLICLLITKGAPKDEVSWRRAMATTFLFTTSTMLFTQLLIKEHHLMTVVPIACVIVVLCVRALWQRWRLVGITGGSVLAVFYLVAALNVDYSNTRALAKTGGVGPWSSALFDVSQKLSSDYPGKRIAVLDWGLRNGLEVLLGNRVTFDEYFWGATSEKTFEGLTWAELISPGKVFLFYTPVWNPPPTPSKGFRDALATTPFPTRRIVFEQRNHVPVIELVEILPAKDGAISPP